MLGPKRLHVAAFTDRGGGIDLDSLWPQTSDHAKNSSLMIQRCIRKSVCCDATG